MAELARCPLKSRSSNHSRVPESGMSPGTMAPGLTLQQDVASELTTDHRTRVEHQVSFLDLDLQTDVPSAHLPSFHGL